MKTPSLFVGACMLISMASYAPAQTLKTWSGALNTDFATGGNWVSGTAPTSTSVGLFSGVVATNQPQVNTTPTINGLSISTATGGWTISSSASGTLIISRSTSGTLFGISTIGQSSGTNTINAAIQTGVSTDTFIQNWSVGSGGTLIINGNISNTSAATTNNGILQIGTASTGTGTLVLNGTNTRSTETQLQAGTVQLGINNAFGTGTLTIVSSGSGGVGATLNAAGADRSLSNAVNLGGGSVLTTGGTNNLTLSGVMSGSGSLVVSSATTILTQNNSFTGSTTINSGATLQLGNGSTTGLLPASGSGVNIVSGGVLEINRSNAVGINTTTNPLTGSGLINNAGTGATTFSGSTSFNGDVQVSSGTIIVHQLNALGGNANTGNVTIGAGATLQYDSSNLTRAGNMTNAGTVLLSVATISNGVTFVAGKTVSGNGNYQVTLNKTGIADFTFAGTVAPGASANSAGTMTFGNVSTAVAAQFASTSTVVWNLTGTGGMAGTDYDTFNLLGGSTASVVSGATLQITLSGITWSAADPYWQTAHSYALFNTNGVTGTYTLTDNVYSGDGLTGTFSFDGQNILYSVVAVPEPSVTVLMGVGAVVLLWRLRRRSLA